MIARVIVIQESLIEEKLPDLLSQNETHRYAHTLSSLGLVEIIELEIEESFVPTAAFVLSERLKTPGYYCHFLMKDRMIVVFPKCICCVMRSRSADAEQAREIGALFDIPIEQMHFERMFTMDHPDVG